MLVSADALSPILALKRNVSLSHMCLFTPCVCCVVVVVLLLQLVSSAVRPPFSRFYPRCLWPHYRGLTPFAVISDELCESRISPIVSELAPDREKSNNLPPALLIPGMLVTRRCPPPCSALAGADSNPPGLNTVGPDILRSKCTRNLNKTAKLRLRGRKSEVTVKM